MSIHDFHSKLMSGKEEGRLFEALRSLSKIGNPSCWKAEGTSEPTPGWVVWEETGQSDLRAFQSEGSPETTLGWVVWQEDGSAGLPTEA